MYIHPLCLILYPKTCFITINSKLNIIANILMHLTSINTILIFIHIAIFLTLPVKALWPSVHAYNPASSGLVASAIKTNILSNLGQFSDRQFAAQLKQDLQQENDSKRNLNKISDISVAELFKLFKLHDPKCDKDNWVEGEELKCLNLIWKSFLPKDY